LPDGYQVAQTAHGVAEFAIRYPFLFNTWKNNTIVCLSARNEIRLDKLLRQLCEDDDISVTGFYEPDLDGELCSVAAIGEGIDKYTSNLPLTLKNGNQNDRYTK